MRASIDGLTLSSKRLHGYGEQNSSDFCRRKAEDQKFSRVAIKPVDRAALFERLRHAGESERKSNGSIEQSDRIVIAAMEA